MKLTVEILRHESGYLQAYVVQQGRRGADIINGRRMEKVHSARMQVRATLQHQLGCAVEITWTGASPDSDLKRASDKKISTPRDSYGWRSL